MSEYGLVHPEQALEFTPTQYILLSKAIVKRKSLELVKMAEAMRVAAWSDKNQFNKWCKEMLSLGKVDLNEQGWQVEPKRKIEGFEFKEE